MRLSIVFCPYLATRPVVGEHVIRLTFINTVTSWEKARFSLSFFDGTKIPPPLKFASPPDLVTRQIFRFAQNESAYQRRGLG